MRTHANRIENLPVYGAVVVAILDGSHRCPESTLTITLLLVFRQPKVNLMILAVSAFSLLEYSFLWHQSGASALSYGGLWNE
jgi:hypothetical protein